MGPAAQLGPQQCQFVDLERVEEKKIATLIFKPTVYLAFKLLVSLIAFRGTVTFAAHAQRVNNIHDKVFRDEFGAPQFLSFSERLKPSTKIRFIFCSSLPKGRKRKVSNVILYNY